MTDEYGGVFGLNKQELVDFSALISGVVIPGLIKISDKYNIDRDSMIKYAADMLTAISELSTFEHYVIEKPDCKYYHTEYGGCCWAQKGAPRCTCGGIKRRCDR